METAVASSGTSNNNGIVYLLSGNLADEENDLRGCDDGDNCEGDCNCQYGD